LHLDWADSRLDCASRIVPMANHASAAVGKNEIGGRGQKRLEFRLRRPGDQPARARTQDFSERIIDFVFPAEGNDSILVHGVTLLSGGSGGLITNPVTPPSSHRHPVSRIAPTRRPTIASLISITLFPQQSRVVLQVANSSPSRVLC